MDVREAQGRNLCRAVSSVQPQVRSLGRALRASSESGARDPHGMSAVAVIRQMPLAALFSLRLGEPCDRGRRERLTARVAIN